jgi:hypothetical protein
MQKIIPPKFLVLLEKPVVADHSAQTNLRHLHHRPASTRR